MNYVRRRRSTACVAVVAALIALGAASAARAQVLQQVPSDALVVIKFSNLKVVSDKVAKFSEAMGLAAVSPEFADPLAAVQEQMQIKEGLDTGGEAAIVFTKAALDNDQPEQALLVLFPVSDYKAFLGNFADVKTEGAISTFKPGDSPEVSAANWGKYAVMTQNKALLKQKPAGLKLSGLAAKEAKERDAFLFANIPMLAEKALPQLRDARKKALGEIDKELGSDPEGKQFAGVVRAAAGQAFSVAEGFLRDATAASISLHLNEQGVSTTMMAEFKPNSYAGKMASQLKNSDQPLMAGLPNRKYFAAGGIVNAPEVSSQIIGDLLDPISKELAATDAAKQFATAIDSFKRSSAATKSVAFGYPMPTGALGADSIVQSVMVIRGDSKIIAESQRQALQGMAEVMKLIPKEGGAPEMSYEFTPGAKTVGEVKLDTYSFDLKMDENNPQAAQMQQFMAFIYGPGGMGGTFGPINKDTFIFVQGGTDKLLNEAVKAAQSPQDPLSGQPAVKKVAAQLPKQRLAVEYVFLDNVINAGVKYAQGFGMQIKMQLPKDLPPVGLTVGTEGSAVRFDAFVPTELVQSVVAAGMQAFMQMQGGGAGGNPDGL